MIKNNLKEATKEFRGWSVYKLAQKLDLPHQTVYSWVWNKTQPSGEHMLKICRLLNCKYEDIYPIFKDNSTNFCRQKF